MFLLITSYSRSDKLRSRNAYASLKQDAKDVEYQAEVAAWDKIDAEGF